MRTRLRSAIVALLAAGALVAAPTAAGAAGHTPSAYNSDLAELRASIAQYHNTDHAMADGYLPPEEGTLLDACFTLPDAGMGVHWADWSLYDTTAEVGAPELLVYEPMRNGGLRLVAVEYIVPQAEWDAEHDDPPMLFDRVMQVVAPPGTAPFYALHAWVFKHNPWGMHADFNPDVTCEHWEG
ncbi:hypothetical protein [Agrococcus jenensis]|uniref:hypothetical protein n=1 Tax=Agrococcus jenensis TaxID=46353 RepID=UPI0011CEAF8D|nr:hypothetical protein [Agrococcus jenensis]